MQSQKARLFCVPSYGLSVVSLYLSSCLCFWLTTVELSEFFLLGAVTSMWLWHWIRGCRVTSPLPACHTDEYQKSDALDMFVCCWLLLYSAILRSWIDTVLAYDSTWVASFLKCVFWISNEVRYLSADMAGATWNCCCLGTFCVHHTTMHSCYSLDLFTFTCLWRSTPSWVLSPWEPRRWVRGWGAVPHAMLGSLDLFCIEMGSDESHFNVSLAVRDSHKTVSINKNF